MGLTHTPLTPEDYTGDPTEDAERLQQWCDYVPTGISWLQQQTELDLDRSPESLRPVWAWGLTQIAKAGPQPAALQDAPPWAQYRPYRKTLRWWQPHTIWMWGAVSAYFGEVFIACASEPAVEWQVLRWPGRSVMGQGELVLLRPAHFRRGKPRVWVCPLATVSVMIGAQLVEEDPRHSPPVGYQDPDRLLTVLKMRLQMFGEIVPDMEPPVEVPDICPENRLSRMLAAPQVAAAQAACPPRWVGIPEGLDDDDFTFSTEEVCAGIGFGGEDGEWSLFLGDGVRPVIDVEIDDRQDRILQVLRAHPLVTEADHVDREVYEWATTGTPTEEEMAALALSALAAAQEHALRLARLGR